MRDVYRDVSEGRFYDRRNADRQENNSNDDEHPRSAETREESQHTGRLKCYIYSKRKTYTAPLS